MEKIAIIKLGAKGDVIRTMPIAKALKSHFPESKITWITRKDSMELLKSSEYIDEIKETTSEIDKEFDRLYNFDIDKEATDLAQKIFAKKKCGFYNEGDYPAAFNTGAEYYLNTLFDDELKRKNRRAYQEMMFEAAELPYLLEQSMINLKKKDLEYANNFLKENNLETKNLIGIHIGASERWPSKVWDEKRVKEFIIRANAEGYKIILFGGPNEIEKYEKLSKELMTNNIRIYLNNPKNTDKEFASLVNLCRIMICSDSFALHVSLALRKPTIGLFFCTSPHEVEEYGLLTKVVAEKLEEFFPEKMNQYDKELTESISAEKVLSLLEKINKNRVVNAIIKKKGEEKFLVVKRKDNDKLHAGIWAFPGGLIENSETIDEALKREVKEEVGLEIDKIIKKISNYSYGDKNVGERIGSCYLVFVKNEEVKLSEEIEDFKWVTIDDFEGLDHIDGLEEEMFAALVENI